MKTVKQIADEIGVSKTAVRNKIKNFPEITEKFAETKVGTLYINKQGEKLIKQAFKRKPVESESQNLSEGYRKVSNNQFAVNFTLEVLTNQLEAKDKQIVEKDKQIEKLQTENEKLINSLENITQSLKGAQALHAGTMQKEFLAENINGVQEESTIIEKEESQQETTITNSEKKGFFKKIFGGV